MTCSLYSFLTCLYHFTSFLNKKPSEWMDVFFRHTSTPTYTRMCVHTHIRIYIHTVTMVHHFWTFLFSRNERMCPWVSTVWWTLPCVGNASCFGYSFENRVKNHFFPLPRPLLFKPKSMWGISDTIQGKLVSPHTSHLGEGANEWKKLKHRQNLRFPFTPLRAHSLAPDTAKAPPFEL